MEMAKRLWPQHWPSFLDDLRKLSTTGGHTMVGGCAAMAVLLLDHLPLPPSLPRLQTEMVLLVYRRLAEDVHCYEVGLTSQRRRELTLALNERIEDVFSFLLGNLVVGFITLLGLVSFPIQKQNGNGAGTSLPFFLLKLPSNVGLTTDHHSLLTFEWFPRSL